MDPEEDIDQDRNNPQNPSKNPRSKSNNITREGNKLGKLKGGINPGNKLGKLKGGIIPNSSKEQKVNDKLNLKEKFNNKFNPRQKLQDAKEAVKKAAKEAVKKAAKKAATAALKNPYVLAAIGIVILIILIIILITSIISSSANAPLTIIKTGPTEAKNGDTLNYQINVSYPETAQDIVITDRIPDGTTYLSSNPSATFDNATKTATWSIKAILPPSADGNISNVDTTIALNLKAVQDNTNLVNVAQGTIIGGVALGGDATGDGNIPPSSNTCGDKYKLTNPLGNFGDPICNFTKDQLFTLIQQKDPQRVHEWFNIIIPGESGYNPNAYNGDSTSGRGAYGLFQMNPNGRGFDNGSVVWSEQASNAIQYNNTVLIPKNCIFRYWDVARKKGIAGGSC